ncbi:MAG: Hsp20/alpha crystallin family protein [bacterium]|nr:Hsp20/alpha crystallin family protein [bacterium]
MKLIPHNPFERLEKIINSHSFSPALDVYEEDDNIIVETPLAGVDVGDVDISVQKSVLTIKGEHKKEHEVDDKNYYRKEIRSGSFYRQVALPVPVKEDKIKAEFGDGVLKITCPKAVGEEAKKIKIDIIKKGEK